MKKILYLLNGIVFFLFMMTKYAYSQVKPENSSLVHSWTFEDGTARDMVGNADGLINGADAAISNGSFSASDVGYIELPASEIMINVFSEVSFEAWFTSVSGTNTAYHMLFYFGNSVNGLGSDGIFFSPARGDNVARTAISCGNETEPWLSENGVNAVEMDDGLQHHVVSTIDENFISLYIDGALIGITQLDSTNLLTNVSNNFAWLSKGGYTGDPTWKGSIHEFNIYGKALSEDEVLYQFQHGPVVGVGPEKIYLTHSWTFEDGTANDLVGAAHGVLSGNNAVISDGVFTATDSGYIQLPASTIAINTYDTITFECWFTPITGVNTGYHMLYYFGNTVNSVGSDGTFFSPARGDNISRSAISCGNESQPWNDEDGINGPELDDNLQHYIVSILTDTSITLYIDTVFMGTSVLLNSNNSIANLSNSFAYLSKSGYTGDPTWKGSIEEFNIYNKALSKEEIIYQFTQGPICGSKISHDISDATLSDLLIGLARIVAFHPDTLNYYILLQTGTVVIPVISATANDAGASIHIRQATSLPGQAYVVVTASNGSDSLTYTVNFLIDPYIPSGDASLEDLTSDGVTVPGFYANLTEYDIILSQEIIKVPVVTAKASNDSASIVITPAKTIPGTTTIEVVAEDGKRKRTYKINYSTGLGIKNALGIFEIFPNPANDKIQIKGIELSSVSVYNMEGLLMKIIDKPEENTIIDISDLSIGLYYIRIMCNNQIFTARFAKK